MRTLLAPLVLASLATACGDDLPDPPLGSSSSSTGVSPSDTTTGLSGSTSTSTTDDTSGASSSSTGFSSVGIPDECTVTADCPRGELCVAPFDQSAGPEGKGPLECVIECVVIMDEDRWCADAAACCDPEAECTDRGYCVYPSDSTGATDSGESTGDTGGSTGTTG
ncbi:hypothetical protein [Paraliomyxa miuraensis]|uniref:hypothetical protein n=1 Tax=Paraliomyxa miuraensis TaxID=376150 RepID=UPI00224F9A6B|nr:hypothetical protein [Paraliomyxa miuraensis]MCX4247900.1 hypothetical protein [Paraliomyxa miuraensis]